ncbi:hypothetical protein SAMN05216343_11840 [Oscillibacter sp. PC13]|nr:hypothetical protein SAMN05216343_11840 [Oscillibacter sp. PC13]
MEESPSPVLFQPDISQDDLAALLALLGNALLS